MNERKSSEEKRIIEFENRYYEEEYPSVSKILKLEQLSPNNKCEYLGLASVFI
jgi:hypothetical protein